MFETTKGAMVGRMTHAPFLARDLQELVHDLARLDREVDDAERVDQLRVLEEIKAAASAAQARATADLDASARAAQADARIRPGDRGKGIAAQVALARRESPVRGSQHLGLAKALVHEMPHTLRALERGCLGEWRATLLVRETACLSREDRATVDRLIAADQRVAEGWGTSASWPRCAGSPTGSTRSPWSAALGGLEVSVGSPAAPPRTPWRT